MPGIYHEPIIKYLIREHGFQKNEFLTTIIGAIRATADPEDDKEDIEAEIEDMFKRGNAWFARRPDAYYLNVEERALVVVEVEYSNNLSEAALADYANLWWAYDSHGSWFFELLSCDRYNTFRHVNLYNGERKGYYNDEEGVNTILDCEKTPQTSALMAKLLKVPVLA
jgi:hypothetical protein